ncbi:phage protein [Xanthobacter sp. ZOL 2024]
MTRQWIRECRLYVGTGSEAIDVSDLRIRFNVEMATRSTPWRADATISNLSNATANKISKTEYAKLTLEAGYDGNFATIFDGQIVQKRGPARETPVDTYFNIQARTEQTAYSYAMMSKTLASGHTFKDQIDACLEALKPYGITAGNIPDLGSVKMPRGRAMFGMVRHQLRSICQTVGANWWIKGGKLQIVKYTEALEGNTVVLNSGTGMIGMPVQTMDGCVEARCLLNPRLEVGGSVQIDEASIQRTKLTLTSTQTEIRDASWLQNSIAADGLYKIVFLSHVGDTRGTEWYSDIVGIPLNGKFVSKRVAQESVADITAYTSN